MGKEAPHVGFPEAVISKYAQKLVAIELTSYRASPPLTTHFSVYRYAQKLVAIGYKVGVVEQMETPQELKARGCHYHHHRHYHRHLHSPPPPPPPPPHPAHSHIPSPRHSHIGPQARNDAKPKGVKKESAVRRELCQVLTKGTAANADVDATYLLAVTEDVETGCIGVCYVDAQVTAATPPHPRPGMPATTKRSAFSPHASATSTHRRRRSLSASASTTSTTRACAPSSRRCGGASATAHAPATSILTARLPARLLAQLRPAKS